MKFKLPELPYSTDAFGDFLSPESFQYHYQKHHQKYVEQTNTLIQADPAFKDLSLEEIVKKSEGPLFNNAAQAWNHTFFWNSLSPDKTQAGGNLKTALERSFTNGLDGFRSEFLKKGKELFGSGWVWLVSDGAGKLEVTTGSNAGTPLKNGQKPILCADVWEHAYYIDHRNARDVYLEKLFDRLSWKFANENFDRPDIANLTAKMTAPN